MSVLESLNIIPLVRKRVREGSSRKKITLELKRLFPGVRGISERSLKRFCASHSLYATSRVSDDMLDVLVAYSVGIVGPTYGRKMMTGFLASQGFRVSQQRVGHSLKRVHPYHHSQRQNTFQQLINPIPYNAAYFGEKLHIDQNEKLILYGVTHVCAVDGFSGKIVSFISMPVKSNRIIYEKMYREVVATYGLWDQLRFDKGREWVLTIFINKALSSYRYCTTKPACIQTTSRKNHTIERLWVEVNKRINYPIKRVLVDMVQKGDLCMDDSLHQFCCSWLTLHVSNVGASLFVASWNAHPIPGGRKRGMKRGVPNVMMDLDNRAKRIDLDLLPSTAEAVHQYIANGGTISDSCSFGTDLLQDIPSLKAIRLQSFCSHYSFMSLFCEVSNGYGLSFNCALKFLIDITYRLAHTC